MKIKGENKQILIATVINYLTFALNIIIAIFYTPFLLNTLGDTDYGIRTFAISFVTYANIIGTGISTAYLRFSNIKAKEYGEDGAKDIDGVFLKIFLTLGLISAFVGLLLFLMFFFGAIPLNNYSQDQIFVISVIVFLSFLTLGFKLPFSIYLLILNFKRKFIFRNTRFLLSTIFEYLFSFLCIILGITVFKSNTIVLSLVSLISELFFGLASFVYVVFVLKHKINFKAKVIEKSVLKEIIVFSLISLAIIAVMSLNDSTDKIILGFISPKSVTFYSLAIVFNAYIKSMADSVSVLYTPRITDFATSNQKDQVQKTFDFVSKICIIILTFVVFGFVCCGKEFLVLWIGKSREEIYYYSLPLMIGLIFLYPQHFSIQIHRAYGKQKFAAISLLITFIVNIGVSVGLVVMLSSLSNNPALGCIIGTLFTYICESVILSFYNKKYLGLKQTTVWLQVATNMLIGFTIAMFVIKLGVIMNFSLRPAINLLVKGLVYVVIFLVVQIIINKKDLVKFVNRNKYEKV